MSNSATAITLQEEAIGPLAGDYSPAGEYHVVSVQQHPRWYEPTIHHSMRHRSRGNWQVVESHAGERCLEQTSIQSEAPQAPLLVHRRRHRAELHFRCHMQVLACPSAMRGIVLGYRHCRAMHELLCEDGVMRWYRREHEDYELLASATWAPKPMHWHELQVSVKAEQATVTIDGTELFSCPVDLPAGAWGLRANQVTRYRGIAITGLEPERSLTDHEPNGVIPRLWKRIDFRGWGSDRNLRWGDVDGDGRPEVVVGTRIDRLGGDNFSNLSSLAAFNLDGELLWTRGTPHHATAPTTSDLCFQLHDLDGCGRAQLVYCWDDRLVVADGASGAILRSRQLPRLPDAEYFSHLLGDSIAFADLLRHGRADCLLVKDRYKNLIAFDRELNELWRHRGRTGHFPHPVDLDGDGRDEVLIGYSCLSADGELRWTHEGDIIDHADNIAACRIGPDGAWRIVICASDAGVYLLDDQGTILRHHAIGHGQSSCVARLHPTRTDHQLLTNTFWGAAGVHCLFDHDGARLAEFEPIPYACLLQAVNWAPLGEDGIPRDLVLLSTHPWAGGLIDGLGQRRVLFPDDGHPVLCCDSKDLDGDGLDEVLSWDEESLWIYKAEVAGRNPDNYPQREPWYNDSNYRTQFGL